MSDLVVFHGSFDVPSPGAHPTSNVITIVGMEIIYPLLELDTVRSGSS